MNKDNQIKEMARDLCNSTMCDLETFNNCRMPRGNCSRCQRVAEDLYNAGYRKAEDVVREIFEELEDAYYECIHIDPTTNIGYLLQTKFLKKLAELKEKYTRTRDESKRLF